MVLKRLEDHAQRQRLVSTLSNICKDYPAGLAILRELIQNADDAGATTFHLVLDEQSYPSDVLIDDALKGYQGPSLKCYNNAEFSAADFENLSNIGESTKQSDASTIGKFGRGFCSTYNWTDCPNVLSKNRLLILDPHQSWPESSGGNTYDVLESADDAAMQNHLLAFKPFVSKRLKEPFPGTVIRLPLRTVDQATKSLIVHHETTIDEVSQVVEEFSAEFGLTGLLFLKNVERFCIQLPKQQKKVFEIVNPEVRAYKNDINEAIRQSSADPKYSYRKSFPISIRHTHGKKSSISNFILSHTIRNPSSEDLQNWSAKQKLASWVAIALPLDHMSFNGRLFSCLPLPIPTIQNAYIHGMFSLSPDRARLHRQSDTSSRHREPGLWNEWLCKELLPQTWTKLLCRLAEMKLPSEGLDNWWPIESHDPNDPFYRTLEMVLRRIEKSEPSVWPTCIGYVKSSDAYLANGNESMEFREALTSACVPVVYLPHRLHSIARSIFKNHQLSPASLSKHFLQRSDNSIIESLTEESKLSLLEYFIKNQCSTCASLPLFPFEDGLFRAIGAYTAFVHRDALDAELFNSAKSFNIDMRRLSTKTQDALRSGVRGSIFHEALQFRFSSDFASYMWQYVLDGKTANATQMLTQQAVIISQAWTWITKHNIDLLDEHITDLPLIPLSNGGYRKIKPTSRGFFLAYAPPGEIGDLIRKISTASPVITSTSLSPAARESLFKAAKKLPILDVFDVRKVSEFLTWLNCHKLKETTDDVRNLILQHILNQLRPGDWPERTTISNTLKSLPLFRKLTWKDEQTPVWTWSRLSFGAIKPIGLNDGLLSIPELVGHQFFDGRGSSGKVLKELDLAKCLSTPEILRLIIQAWNEGHDAQWSDEVKTGAAKLILSNYWHLSDLTEVIGSLRMIPTTCLDPTTTKPISAFKTTEISFNIVFPDFARPKDLIDRSKELLRGLFFEHESVFPVEEFYSKYKKQLLECGMKTKVDVDMVLARIDAFTGGDHSIEDVHKRATNLLRSELEWISHPPEITLSSWLPVRSLDGNLSLSSAGSCRSMQDKQLVSFVMPIVELDVSISWRIQLRWMNSIPTNILLSQLTHGIKRFDHGVVDSVLITLATVDLGSHDLDALKASACILTTGRQYAIPSRCFQRYCSRLSPYAWEVDLSFGQQHRSMLERLQIKLRPSLSDLIAIQQELNSGPELNDTDVAVVLEILSQAAKFSSASLHGLRVLSEAKTLCVLEDVIFRDDCLAKLHENTSITFCHPEISAEVARGLMIEPLSALIQKADLQLVDEDDDEYIAQESASTSIASTLERYLPSSAFRELLSNAEDAEATLIHFCLDHEQYSADGLIIPELAQCQGPALLVHNDKVFNESDWIGFRNIGKGSKFDDPDKIGQFGRGAQSMFHYTDTIFLISGKYLVILDPLQKVLPINYGSKLKTRTPGIRVLLSRVHETSPNQLLPFRGRFGFEMTTDEYAGTLFRLPLRMRVSELTSTVLGKAEVHLELQRYLVEARISLLFLNHISSIVYSVHGPGGIVWSVKCQTKSVEDVTSSQFQTMTCAVQNEGKLTEDKFYFMLEPHSDEFFSAFRSQSRKTKRITIGIAARVSSTAQPPDVGRARNTENDRKAIARSRIFSTLPLPIDSHFPVHIHATFSLAGDRRSLIVSEETSEVLGSTRNKRLLEQLLPCLYVKFLAGIAQRVPSREIYKYWPTVKPPQNSCSEYVWHGFWTCLSTSTDKLFARASLYQEELKASELHALTTAMFDYRDYREANTVANGAADLRAILQPLCVSLCQTPPLGVLSILKKLSDDKKLTVNFLTRKKLREIFKNNGTATKSLKRNVAEMGTRKLIPPPLKRLWKELELTSEESVEELDGCNIVPLQNNSIGKLRCKTNTTRSFYFCATKKELQMFHFAGRLLVHEDALESFRKCSDALNIRALTVNDLKHLLPMYETPSKPSSEGNKWLEEFWAYFNARVGKDPSNTNGDIMEDIAPYPLCLAFRAGIPTYRSLKDLDEIPCVIQPTEDKHRKLCAEIPGLSIFEQNLLPTLYQNKGAPLDDPKFCNRLVKAIVSLAEAQGVCVANFVAELQMLETLRDLVVCYLNNPTEPPGDLQSLRLFPLWPTYVGNWEHLISADKALVAEQGNILVSWMDRAELFILPAYASEHQQILERLSIRKVRLHDLLEGYILPQIPETLSAENEAAFLTFVDSVKSIYSDSSTLTLLKDYRLAVNGKRKFRRPDELYDHRDEIFQAAFRNCAFDKFLTSELQAYRQLYCALGLRQRLHGDSPYYFKCLQEIRDRLQSLPSDVVPDDLHQDTHIVLDPLTKSFQGTIKENDWASVRAMSIFIIKKDFHEQPQYRRAIMREIAIGRAMTLDDLKLSKYAPICWSVYPFAILEPSDYVLHQAKRDARPTTSDVFSHLAHLASHARKVSSIEEARFLNDVYACYDYLQDHCSDSRNSFKLVKDQRIWYNVDSKAKLKDLSQGWLPLKHLLLQSSCDAPPLRTLRPSLTPYERLLKSLGCQVVRQPTVEATKVIEHSMTKSLKEMRHTCEMLDTTLEVDGKNIRAHRLVLSAASSYCKRLFSGDWLDKDCIQLDSSIFTYSALCFLVEAAYEEPLDWSTMQLKTEIETKDNIAEDDKKLTLLLELHRAADYFMMDSLSRQVENRILDGGKRFVRLDSVDKVLKEATSAHATKVEQLCKAFQEQNRVALENRQSSA